MRACESVSGLLTEKPLTLSHEASSPPNDARGRMTLKASSSGLCGRGCASLILHLHARTDERLTGTCGRELDAVLSLDIVGWSGSNETSAGAGAGTYPNYMIPVWKQRMFDRANNLTEAGIQEFLEAAGAGLAYRLVAYQGCRIIGLLSNLEREKYGNELRDRLARHGALETVTRAMGAHMVCPRVLAMGCIALQAMADGHREHSDTVIALGGAEVLPDLHTFFDSKPYDGSGTRRCHTRRDRSYARGNELKKKQIFIAPPPPPDAPVHVRPSPSPCAAAP